MHHLVGEDTQRPPISHLVIATSSQHLRSKVLRGSAESLSDLAVSNYLGHSEISQTRISIVVHKKVLKF